MGKSVFNKKLKKSCLWCAHGKKLDFCNDIFCKKRGVTTKLDSCRHYKYDPLKRTPNVTKPKGEFTVNDFII